MATRTVQNAGWAGATLCFCLATASAVVFLPVLYSVALIVGLAAVLGSGWYLAGGPTRSADRTQPALGFLAAGALCVLLPSLLVPMFRFSIETTIVAAVVVWSGVRIAGHVADGRPRLMDLFFWLLVYIWLGLAPLAQMSARSYPQGGAYSEVTLTKTALIIAAGVIAYEIGRWIARAHPARIQVASRGLSEGNVAALALVAVAAASIVVAVIGLGTFFTSRQTVSESFLELAGGSVSDVTGPGVAARRLVEVCGLVALMGCLALLKVERRPRWLVPTIAVLLVVNIIVSNPITSSRYWFATVAVGVSSVLVPWRRRTLFRLLAASVIVLGTFSMDYLDAYRWADRIDVSEAPTADRLVSHNDYSPSQQMYDLAKHTDLYGHTMGRQLAGAVGVLVPRTIWEDKPAPSWQVVSPHLWYKGTLPLPGELFLDFGWFGLFIGMGVYGWGASSLDRAALPGLLSSRRSWLSVWVPALASYQLFILRGPLLPVMGVLIPMLLAMWWCSRRLPGASRGPAQSERHPPPNLVSV
jgi:hypothetical protein